MLFRRVVCTLCLLPVLLVIGAAVGVGAAPPDWEPAVWMDHPVRLELADRAELDRLLATVPVASFHREQLQPVPGGGLVWQPRVTEAEEAALVRAGWRILSLPDVSREGRMAAEAAWTARAAAKAGLVAGELTTYPSHSDVDLLLQLMAATYPDIARTVTWGTSVQGRQLWGLVISGDVQNTAAEPEVRLSASIHGDEPVGLVMLMNLADYLTANYGQPGYEDVTALVDGTEIHILPLHNPDGYAVNSRRNAHDVDLNRNFLDPAGTHLALEPENEDFVTYSLGQHFVVSANAHSGALVVNYPWDYTFTLPPDEAAIINLSNEYASHNQPMADSSVFPGGITNGAEWYVATGTLQDWSYDRTDCIDLTLELNDIKWPPPVQLPGLWQDNRESYLALVAAARWGISGVVTDANTGAFLDATLTVSGIDLPVNTDPAHGDYYKLLPTGTWDLTVSAEGYAPATIGGIATTWGTGTTVNVALTVAVADVPPLMAARVRAAPNPFNGGTSLSFVNPRDGWVELAIYDLRGRRVAALLADYRPEGPDSVSWDGTDDQGRPLGSGVYVARLRVGGGGTAVVKVGLVK